jgi:hypothetical protein
MKKFLLIIILLCCSLSAFSQSWEECVHGTPRPRITIEFNDSTNENIEIKGEYASNIYSFIDDLFSIPVIDRVLYKFVCKIYNGNHIFHYNGFTFIFNPKTDTHIIKTKDFVMTFHLFDIGLMADQSLMGY